MPDELAATAAMSVVNWAETLSKVAADGNTRFVNVTDVEPRQQMVEKHS